MWQKNHTVADGQSSLTNHFFNERICNFLFRFWKDSKAAVLSFVWGICSSRGLKWNEKSHTHTYLMIIEGFSRNLDGEGWCKTQRDPAVLERHWGTAGTISFPPPARTLPSTKEKKTQKQINNNYNLPLIQTKWKIKAKIRLFFVPHWGNVLATTANRQAWKSILLSYWVTLLNN